MKKIYNYSFKIFILFLNPPFYILSKCCSSVFFKLSVSSIIEYANLFIESKDKLV